MAEPTPIRPAKLSGREYAEFAATKTNERVDGLDQSAMLVSLALARAASAHVQESESQVHRPRGWSWTGFRLMYMIWLFDEIEARSLARLAGVSRQTTSTVLSTLESNGLVTRERKSPEDRRLVSISLTAEGLAALEHAAVVQNELESEWFGDLTEEERHVLAELLDRVARRIRRSRHRSADTARDHHHTPHDRRGLAAEAGESA